MTCTYADDAYLIAAFPGVVVRTPEMWLVTVLAAQVGAYTVTLAGAPFAYAAVAEDDESDIADGLIGLLGGQMLATVSLVGASALSLGVLGPAALDVTATGPAVDTIEATLVSGGDSNATARAFWLERAKCGLPPCCVVTCAADYTLMHAALAAHLLFTMGNLGASGSAANDFESMRLGPAALTRGVSAWAAASPADGDLAKTGSSSCRCARGTSCRSFAGERLTC